MKNIRSLLCIVVFLLPCFSQASNSGVVLLYHHVDTRTPAVTSVSPAQFKQHIRYLVDHHHIVPLEKIVNAVKNQSTLPDKAVAITFDDGYENIFTHAHPILAEQNIPYTVFINPALIDKQPGQLSWKQIKLMQQQGASFANHTQQHQHLLTRLEGEDEAAWLKRVLEDIEQAQQQLEQELGKVERYFAYPYGEYNLALQQALEDKGFTAFTQNSGAIGKHSNHQALPRFPAAGIYASMNTLKVKLNSLAMPVLSSSLTDPHLGNAPSPTNWTLTVEQADLISAQFACYWQGETLAIKQHDGQFTISLPTDFPIGRSRINCTAPSQTHSGRFYWYSQPFFRPSAMGTWPD